MLRKQLRCLPGGHRYTDDKVIMKRVLDPHTQATFCSGFIVGCLIMMDNNTYSEIFASSSNKVWLAVVTLTGAVGEFLTLDRKLWESMSSERKGIINFENSDEGSNQPLMVAETVEEQHWLDRVLNNKAASWYAVEQNDDSFSEDGALASLEERDVMATLEDNGD